VIFFIDVLCTVRLEGASIEAPLHAINKNQNLLRLVNGIGVSIHHIRNWLRFCPVAFIFDEDANRMVNRWCAMRCTLRPGHVPA
jgi:hypothetical protein